MKHRPPPQVRDFRCDVCGTVTPATKRRGRRTSLGHIKTMYCYQCRSVTQHTQIGI